MDTSDIAGARPKALYPDKRFGRSDASPIRDNLSMAPAGGMKKQVDAPGSFMKMGGGEYDQYQSKQQRDPMNTRDINGAKRNQFGQKMEEAPQYAAPVYQAQHHAQQSVSHQ